MRKEIVFLLCTTLITIPLVHAISQDPKAVQQWFKQLPYKKQKITNLHFYIHDSVLGSNPTAYQIAESNISSTSPTSFGRTFMSDDSMTISPDPSSSRLGKSQGIFGSSSLEEPRIVMYINFVFTQGKYNGSTLQLLGSDPCNAVVRESSIVGGTGVFRLARGVATAQTYFISDSSAIFEYNLMVIHY